MRNLALTATVVLLVLSAFLVPFAYGSRLELEKDQVLFYKYARTNMLSGGQSVGDAAYQILSFDEETLDFQITGVSAFNYSVGYKDGIPVSVSRLEVLIYLPPECLSRSLEGDLDWLNFVQTSTLATVTNMTGRVTNVTLDAGTFEALNITMGVGGMDFGSLSMLYDVDSGVLVYQQWIPSYGDVIVQRLVETRSLQEIQQGTLLNLVLPSLTVATPVVAAVYWAIGSIRKRKSKPELLDAPSTEALAVSSESAVPLAPVAALSKKLFGVALVGAVLSLVAVFLPWTTAVGASAFLPLSLPAALLQSALLPPASSALVAVGLLAHVAAIAAWVSLLLYGLAKRRLVPQVAAVASAVLAFVSVGLFVQSGLAMSWGFFVVVAAGVVTLLSLVFANVNISIALESDEEAEEAKASEAAEPSGSKGAEEDTM